jgi:hypothetical protein
MAIFNLMENFIIQAKNEIETSVKSVLPELKEKAQDVVVELIYQKYEPSFYERIMELIEAFEIQCKWEGNTCYGILSVSNRLHSENPKWIGDKVYPLDEIIVDYFSRSHTYSNGVTREGVDVMGTIENRYIAEILQQLLTELKKYFDII